MSAALSLRDPAGRLVDIDGRLILMVRSSGVADLEATLASRVVRTFLADGRLVGTRVCEPGEFAGPADALLTGAPGAALPAGEPALLLEHERIWFRSFPFEWPVEMLHAAAVLTLDLTEEALADGLGLKDATPYNVLFQGPKPVFVDLLSFERRQPGDSRWLPYAQFVRTFLLPLLAFREFGIPLSQSLLSRRDGLEPEHLLPLMGGIRRLLPPFFSLVTLPAWLGSRGENAAGADYAGRAENPEKARYVLGCLLGQLRRQLTTVAPRERKSAWTTYMAEGACSNNYSSAAFDAKDRFARDVLAEFRPETVLDIGCNTGHFSLAAAEAGARVVAIDSDPISAGVTWRRAATERRDVLPLVVDLARPSPGVGWCNEESPSFLQRARGQFSLVLMLAVVHHLMVSEQIPLVEIMRLAAELTRDLLLIEFIAPEDSMFQRLTRGREQIHAGLTCERFEAAALPWFEIVRSERIEGTHRWLYLMRRKQQGAPLASPSALGVFASGPQP